MSLDWRTVVAGGFEPDADPVQRVVPFTGLVALALVLLPFSQVEVTRPGLLITAVVMVVVTVIAAAFVPWESLPETTQLLLPATQLAAVVLLEVGTSPMAGIFALTVLIPAFMLAVSRSRLGPFLAAGGVLVVAAAPLMVAEDVLDRQVTVIRCVLIALATLGAALAVNRAVRTARAQKSDLVELAARLQAFRDYVVEVLTAAQDQAVIGADSDGVVDLFNPGAERLLGYSAEELVGRRRLVDLLDPAGPTVELAGAVPSVGDLGPNEVGVRDATFLRRDGAPRYLRLWIFELDEPLHGTLSGRLVLATDISAEVEARELQSRFTALVSHELRTPLSSILGYLELIRDDDDNMSEDQRRSLVVIERNARRLLSMVSDLLVTAQVDAGRFQISRARVDLAQVATSSVAALRPLASAAGITLEVDLPGPALVDGDFVRLGQVVDNLLGNALKFTGRGGTIEVSLRHESRTDASYVVLSVRDTGTGIAPEELSHLTERYFRSAAASAGRVAGTGLGLAIVATIVAAHDGELEISSVLGEGSTFSVVLPEGAVS